MINTVLNVFTGLAAAVVIYVYVRAYRESDPVERWYCRAWVAARGSLTLLWNYFVIAATGIITQLANVASIFDPGTAATIQSQIPVEWLAYFLVGMAVLTVATRMRSLWTMKKG